MDFSFSQQQMRALAQVLRCAESPEFPVKLRHFLNEQLSFSTFLIVIFPPGQAPRSVYHWIPDAKLDGVFRTQYFQGAFLLDPFYQLSRNFFDDDAHRLRDTAPDRFFSSEYYRKYYGETDLIDEVGFLARLSNEHVAHLSISRSKTDQLFNPKELSYLHQLSPLLTELMRQHCEWIYDTDPQSSSGAIHRPLDKIIYDFALSLKPGGLTTREAEITALILQGHSNSSASLVLGISKGTTKVHRRNIHRKLDISSQAELFATFSSALSSRPN